MQRATVVRQSLGGAAERILGRAPEGEPLGIAGLQPQKNRQVAGRFFELSQFTPRRAAPEPCRGEVRLDLRHPVEVLDGVALALQLHQQHAAREVRLGIVQPQLDGGGIGLQGALPVAGTRQSVAELLLEAGVVHTALDRVAIRRGRAARIR